MFLDLRNFRRVIINERVERSTVVQHRIKDKNKMNVIYYGPMEIWSCQIVISFSFLHEISSTYKRQLNFYSII